MKVTSLIPSFLLLALASISLANPFERAESLHIRNFYVQHADDGTGALQFALHSSVTGLYDDCTLAWYVIHLSYLPSTMPQFLASLYSLFQVSRTFQKVGNPLLSRLSPQTPFTRDRG